MIILAFVLTTFIVAGGLVLLKEDCGWDFSWLDRAFGDPIE